MNIIDKFHNFLDYVFGTEMPLGTKPPPIERAIQYLQLFVFVGTAILIIVALSVGAKHLFSLLI